MYKYIGYLQTISITQTFLLMKNSVIYNENHHHQFKHHGVVFEKVYDRFPAFTFSNEQFSKAWKIWYPSAQTNCYVSSFSF